MKLHPRRPGIRRALLLGVLAAALPAAADSLAGLASSWVTPALYPPEHCSWLTCRAGDINGDGFDDIIMGIPFSNGANGVVEVYYGGPSGLSTTGPDLTIEGEDPSFGWVVGRAGDMDHDGFDDIVVGAPGAASGLGVVYVYAGGPAGPALVPTWTATGDGGGFGDAVMTAGNVDANPGDEIIVGADLHHPDGVADGTAFGSAYAYSVTAAGLVKVWEADGADYIKVDPAGMYVENFGFSVSTAGDVNGDGYDDVIVGAPTPSLHGWNGDPRIQSRVYVFHGSATGLSKTCAWFQGRNQEMSWMPNMGMAVARLGDMDKDGYDDVIVGSPGTGVDYVGVMGEVEVFRGGPSGLQATPWWTVQGPDVSYYGIGTSLGSAGDFNGDGYRDVIVGNTNYMTYLYYGSASGISRVPSEIIDRKAVYSGGAWWPQTMYAGDINGDGSDDLVVAATGSDGNTGAIAGSRAEIFYGTGFGMGDGDRRPGAFGLTQTVKNSGKIIQSGESVLAGSVRLSARVSSVSGGVLEIEVQPAGLAFQDQPTGFSSSVANGTVTGVDVDLVIDRGYHWQARVHTASDIYGPWMGFGMAADLAHDVDFSLRSNEAPVGRNPGERIAATQASMAVGSVVYDRTPLSFEIDATDGHGDSLQFLVEVRPLGEAFRGTPTHSSAVLPPGGTIAIEAQPGAGAFHWQWSLVDALGAGAGTWTVFGGNAEGSPDFSVGTDGSTGAACSGSAGGAMRLGIVALLLAAGFRRV